MNRRARRAAAAQNSDCTTFRSITTPPRLRRGLLLGTSGLTLAIALGAPNEAAAVNECGVAAGVPPSVNCTSAGNPYAGGIRYDVDDLTIVVKTGVIVNTTTAAGEQGGIVSGVNPSASTGTAVGDQTLKVNSGVAITTDGDFADAISVGSGGPTAGGGTGSVSITSKATISTSGDGADGIRGVAYGGDVKVVAAGSITTTGSIAGGIVTSSTSTTNHVLSVDSTAAITTSGVMSWGIRVDSEFNTNVDVVIKSSGKITTAGDDAEGIYGSSTTTASIDSDVTITSSSAIVTAGEYSAAVRGYTLKDDSAIAITSSGKITTAGNNSQGLLGYTKGARSDINIANSAPIGTSGRYAEGIRATTVTDKSNVVVTSDGRIATTGDGSSGIYSATRYGNSDISITSNAKITTAGEGAVGIFATTDATNSDVTIVSTAAIVTDEIFSDGITAYTDGTGGAISVNSSGAITTSADRANGIDASTNNTAAPVTIVSSGRITTNGLQSSAIIVANDFSSISITSTGRIVAGGDYSDGISARTDAGGITIDASNAITTSGGTARGIVAVSNLDPVDITSDATIKTSGGGSQGIRALAIGGDLSIASLGSITTTGDFSDGVYALADNINVTVSDVSAAGQDSSAINVANTNDGLININVTGDAMGGWGQGQGVKVKATGPASLSVGAGATVGAASDFAVSEGGDDMSIFNKGTITGYIDLSAGTDSLSNGASGVWALRNFADTDGDGKRDTEGVAFASFGSGADTFDNAGTLSLGKASGAAFFNTTGAIADPHGTDGNLMLSGVEQGQIVGLEQFTNSGTITLQDNKTGDFLAITDANFAGPGGGGIFTSNGGSLHLDVRLDDGSSGKTDMLFLDIVKSGVGGGTQVFVNQVGGAGALTKGDGIEIINVDVSSTSDAFTLGAPVVAGAFEYDLEFQNLAATDQNWYLRSHPFAAAAAYPSISSSALTTWRADLDSLENRLDDLRFNMNASAVTVPLTVAGIAEGGSMTLDPARFTGGWFSMTDSDDTVSQSGIAGFSQETSSAQMGFDFALDNVSGNDDWLVLGAFGGQGWSQADFDDADSSADFDIAAMGVYASYFRGPYHFDALVKFDWLDGDYNSDVVNGGGDVTLPVFGVSLNTGYQFDLTSSETGGLSLQPVAALDYAHVGGDTFHDDSGAEVQLLEMDSLRGRLGAKLVQQLLPGEDGTGPLGNVYLSAGIAQEFLGEAEARVTGVTLTQELPQTTFELGAGFDIALPGQGVRFTFDTSADFSESEDNYGATGGVKFTW